MEQRNLCEREKWEIKDEERKNNLIVRKKGGRGGRRDAAEALIGIPSRLQLYCNSG